MKDDVKVTRPLGRTIAILISVIMLMFTLISVAVEYAVAFNLRKERLELQTVHFIEGVSATIEGSMWSLNNEIMEVVLTSISSLDGVVGVWFQSDGIEKKIPSEILFNDASCDKILSKNFETSNLLAGRPVTGDLKVCYNEPSLTLAKFISISGGVLPRILAILLVSLVTFILIRRLVVGRLKNTISVLRTDEDFRFDPADHEKDLNNLDEIDILEVELTKSNARLKAANERITHKKKMEAVGTLTGAVSHEFNNLLAVIAGGVELATTANKVKKVDEYLQWTKEGINSASEIANQLLTMTDSADTILQSVALDDFMGEISRGMQSFAKANVDLTLENHAEGKIITSRARLVGATLNLLKNSIEAMHGDKGRVFLEIREAIADEIALFDGDQDQEYLIFQVVDNAGSIPLELREKLFNPFFTTKNARRGTGLGLWTVYNYAKTSGGMALYHPLPNGSCFRFILPRIVDMEVAYKDTNIAIDDSDINDLNLMIVEDEPSLMLIYKEFFQQYTDNLYCASTVKGGLELLEQEESFDAIICDYLLPDGLGTQIIKKASEVHSGTVKLIISGNPDVKDGMNLGADEVFKKPIELQLLLDCIKQQIHSRNEAHKN